MRSERARMSAILILTLLFGMLVALGATAWAFSDARMRQNIQEQGDMALTAIELVQRSELSAEEAMNALSGNSYSLAFAAAEETDPALEGQALAGRVVYDGAQLRTLFSLDGVLCEVRREGSTLVAKMAMFYLMMMVAGFVTIALAFTGMATELMVRPLTQMCAAAQRLAQGDFSVRVPERRHGSEQMRALARDFNAMAQALSSVEYLRRDFTASVSHEIKTPVAAIHSFAQLMCMPGVTPPQQAQYAQAISRESRRLSRMADSLLRLTRLESGSAPVKAARYRVGEQLREMLASLLPAMEEKHIELEADIPDVAAEADEDLMAQVFQNILSNAIKFTPEGGRIEVGMRRTPQRLTVRISDTGCGMDEKTQAHIFDKFYQADDSHATQGAGLGLALVRRIMQLHGGEVLVESRPGEGSTFTVVLPQRA